MLSRSQVREHAGTYQTIAPNAPYGLQCLKRLFEQEDSSLPNKLKLQTILAKDFRALENGNERSKGREDIIELILSRRSRYSKYQTDLTQAWCITNPNKTQTVLFESIRFIIFQKDTEWVRIPLAGRLEVRAYTVAGKTTGEIVLRKLTMDLSAFWKRKTELDGIVSPTPTPTLGNSYLSVDRTPQVQELPAFVPGMPSSPVPDQQPIPVDGEGQQPKSPKTSWFLKKKRSSSNLLPQPSHK
jgi:hypothetical protein